MTARHRSLLRGRGIALVGPLSAGLLMLAACATPAQTPAQLPTTAPVQATIVPTSPITQSSALGAVGDQQGATVFGMLAGRAGEAIPEISVVAYREQEGHLYPAGTVDTDRDGGFGLVLAPGQYRLGFFESGGRYRAEFYPNADDIMAAGIVTAPLASPLHISLDPAPVARAAMWIDRTDQALVPARARPGGGPSVAMAAPARQDPTAEECAVLSVTDTGVTEVHACQLPLPMSGTIQVEYSLACKNPTNVFLETGSPKVRLCEGGGCEVGPPVQLPDGSTTYHWSIALDELREGALEVHWTCKGNPFLEDHIATVLINDPSGRVTLDGIEKRGVVVELWQTPGSVAAASCKGSNLIPKPAPAAAPPANLWSPIWSGYTPIGTAAIPDTQLVTTTTGLMGSPGYYGWTVTPGKCYYVRVNTGHPTLNCATGVSPVIGYVAGSPITQLDFTCP